MRKNDNLQFRGFEGNAAKRSMSINKIVNSFIANVESDLNIITSTPKASALGMAVPFSKIFHDAMKMEFHITMDYDSGYISNNQEWNSEYCLENVSDNRCEPSGHVYLSEDALLEKPEINVRNIDLSAEIDKEDYEETRRLFNSPGTVISGSVVSEKSSCSGSILENDSCSDMSLELSQIEPIIIENKELEVLGRSNFEVKSCKDSVNTALDKADELCIDNSQSTDTDNKTEQLSFLDLSENVQSTCDTTYSDIQNVSDSESNKDEQVNNSTSNVTNVTDSVLNNVTNICTNIVPKEKKRLTLVFSNVDKENVYSVKRKYPSMTPEKKFENPVDSNLSPDLFEDDAAEVPVDSNETRNNVDLIAEEKYITKKDHRLLKRVQIGLSGVLPPPSVTMVQLSANEILTRLASNKQYFWGTDNVTEQTKKINESSDTSADTSYENSDVSKSLLVNVESEREIVKDFPKVLEQRYHGLHFNRSKVSEEFEKLCDRYAKRFVGAETQSTLTVFETNVSSPSKRKTMKQRWAVKSPGRRLSHLARRRITFSSANLQAGGSSMAGSRTRQILVDARKLDLLNRRKSPHKSPRKTPKKTPSKSPRIKTRTPSSSAKKKLALRFRKLTGEFGSSSTCSESKISSAHTLFKSPDKSSKFEKPVASTCVSSKRALFQSPDRNKRANLFAPSTSGVSASENEIKKSQPRRALFLSPSKNSPLKNKNSPFKKSPLKHMGLGLDKKRKRMDSESDIHPPKLARSISVNILPSESESHKAITRTHSEMNTSLSRSCSQNELSDVHKKKLQWAVYEALKSQNVTPSHAQFKLFASILARVTRRLLPNLAVGTPRLEGSTSERMLRIARHHVYAVIKGRSVEEIISEYWKNRTKNQKPQGYVALENFNNAKNKTLSTNKENVFQDRANTIESWEKRKLEQLSKPKGSENKIDRIRKVINFGDDNR